MSRYVGLAERDETGVWVGTVVGLPGAITQADRLADLGANIAEAIWALTDERTEPRTSRSPSYSKVWAPLRRSLDVPADLDAISPDTRPARDATQFRRIIAARKAVDDAEGEMRAAIAAARSAGDSWTVIGAALDTTRQAAYQRFGR